MRPSPVRRLSALCAVLLTLPWLLAAASPTLSTLPAPSADRLETHPLLDDSDNPNSAVLQLLRAPVGEGLPESVEDELDRLIVVLSGEATATLGGEDHGLTAGSAALIPAGATAAVEVTVAPFEAMVARFRPGPGSKDRAPHVAHAADLPTYSLQDGKLRVQILIDAAAQSPAALSILTAEVGASAPPHDHGQAEEIVYLLEGKAAMTLQGHEFEAGPRSAFRIPGHADHTMEVVDGPMIAVQIYLPGGPEQRFKAGKTIEPDDGGA